MRPRNESLVQVIREGAEEAQDVAIMNKLREGETLRAFANRMVMRLNWAANRIEELEVRRAEDSWAGEVDRMGGSFSDREVADSLRETW